MPPKKNQKMSLGTFLQDENYGSWADEMEDMPLPTSDSKPAYGSDRRNYSSMSGSGGGFADRRDTYVQRDQLPLPTQPPYTAHLANLSFDATQDDVNEFFKDCQVTNVRIVEDKLDRKPKGFGYVEFATLEGLKAALALGGNNLAGRQVRVSVAEPPKERQDGRDFSDWSRKGPLPDLPQNQRRVSDRPPFAGRNFDAASDAGNERGSRRAAFEQGDGKTRDFSTWERKGPLSPAAPAPTSLREGGRQASKDGPGGFRKNSPAWGEGRSQDGSRPPRREFSDKPAPERQPTASELDNQWRARMRPDPAVKSPTPEASEPSSPAAPPALATRPKLNLQKRTVSEAVEPAQSSPAPSKSSPFGAARPVDTATKEKEVEEKRQIALRQKKEAEDKAKAEKAEEKRLARDRADAEKSKEPPAKETTETSESKNDEGETAQAGPKFDILRRADAGASDMLANDDDDEETEKSQPVDDKAVKPKEVVRTPPTRANGSWRAPKSPPASDNPTGDALEEDGWSTVSKPNKQRNNRRNPPSRAIAS